MNLLPRIASSILFLSFPFVEVIAYFGDPLPDPLHQRCTSESKIVSACIHEYLEKDFIAISPIVYPKGQRSRSDSDCRSSEDYERRHTVLMDGPTLQNSCNDLHEVFQCLYNELRFCVSLDRFFQLRHLVYSLKKVMIWLCGTTKASNVGNSSDQNQHANVRIRFLGLLESINCIECVRMYRTKCESDSAATDVSLWHNVLRLQIGVEQCPAITRKMECMQKDNLIRRICGKKASEVHKNLTDAFLNPWCTTAPFTMSSGGQKSENSVYLALAIVPIIIPFTMFRESHWAYYKN